MQYKSLIIGIEKYLNGLIISNVDFDVNYDIYYDTDDEKIVLDLTVTIDIKKMYGTGRDKKYVEDVHGFQDSVLNINRYLSIDYTKIDNRFNYVFDNREIFNDESKELKRRLEEFLSNIFGPKQVEDSKIYVDVYLRDDDQFYSNLEVGAAETIDWNLASFDDISSIVAEFVEDQIHQTNDFPSIRSVVNDNSGDFDLSFDPF